MGEDAADRARFLLAWLDGAAQRLLAQAAPIRFGIALVVAPGAGALALIWLIAAYAIIFGLLLLGLAFRLRGMAQRHPAPAAP